MIKITDLSTKAPDHLSKDEIKEATKAMAKEIADLQYVMMAQKKYSLLVIFQGMDSSGKDGATKHVFTECGPAGVHVFSFKKPTDDEFAHDFLWRVHKRTPAKGMIHVFNRSHYEDVLIQRVHGWIDETRIQKRMAAINAFEDLVQFDNNTTILKFFLNLSKDRQQEKLQERIDMPRKNWKHNANDWKEREHWDKYMECYEDVLNTCNTVPWHVVPADQRWYRNYVVAQKVLETMKGFDLAFPLLETD